MTKRILFSLLAITGLLSNLPAATPLFDFEQDAEVSPWKARAQGWSKLERSPRFATSGQASLGIESPAWKAGLPEWPAFENRPPTTNWSGYDRLVVDLTNPNLEPCFFSLFVSDSKVPFRQGLSYRFDVPSRGFKRFEIPLSSFPKQVNRSDIAILHFFTERPKTDLALYLDNLTLLRPGESLPEPGTELVRQLAALALDNIGSAEQVLAKCRQAAQAVTGAVGLAETVRTQFAPLEERLRGWRAALGGQGLTVARLNEVNAELTALPQQAERALSIVRAQKACRELGLPSSDMLVGVATSMEKILPRQMPVDLKCSKEIVFRLARNEKESFQLLVLPVSGPLRKLSVTASDLKGDGGALLRRENVQCDVVGYVQTKQRPPYDVPQVGWWPDPILDFLGPVDIGAGDLQAFWIRVRAPKDQVPGRYRGTLTVAAEGVAPVELELVVRVYTFALPDHSPLPLAITFGPHDFPTAATEKEQAEWRKSGEYPVNAWKKHKLRWADFLADYYFNYDSLYHQGVPDFEVLTHLHRQGRLCTFNLGYYGQAGTGAEQIDRWKSTHLPRLREGYAKAKELGLLDHAYIYGCDEAPAELFPQVEQAAAILRAEFPGVLIATTTYDHSYSLDSVIKSMDAFCPLTPKFEPDKAAKARTAGKHVWWYICCGPHHPHANMFIEYPAIEGRLLMGAMTARQRPDGFLYYQISIWNSRRPITSGPFTDWDPRSWTTYHGDGAWTCVGPDGTPLPTIRLENFRDGLEDFAYVVILEEIIRQRQARTGNLSPSEQQWLADAKAALAVPESVVKSMTDYSRDPARIYEWRDRMGDLIDRSGAAEVNPWGANFGVRGFRAAGR